MSLTSCIVHFTKQSERTVYLSSSLMKELNLTRGKTAILKLGKSDIHCTVRTIKKSGNHLYISSLIRQHLKVPRSGTCYVVSNREKEIQIGPLIGILSSAGTRTVQQPFGSRTALVKQFLRVGYKKAFYFAFSPQDIHWQQEKVTGFFLDSNGGWVRKTVPLPDVVYNRLASRRAESSATMESFKERFVHKNIPIFNWNFFNKSDVYNLLEGEPEAQYVPESYTNPPANKIKEMLEKHQFVYLKPTGGSLGKGIFRLTYHPKRGYFSRYRRNGKNVLLRFSRFSSLMQLLSRQGNLKNYVVQQGIRLVEMDNCPIDFRFHMNKNARNQWVPAGIGAKKAGKGSITTHIKNGGSLMTPEYALNKIYGNRAGDLLEKAKHVAVKLSEAIERNYPHTIGELGFDLGIDRNENIWMFEANAKPGRSIFKHPSLKNQGIDTLNYIFEHCLYLSKFREKGEA